MRKDLSVASFAFHGMLAENTMDIFGYLESIKYRYNLEYADIWNGFIKSYEIEDLKKVKRAMDEKGLKLANLCCDCAHPWHEDPDELQKLHDMADKCLLAAEILEAKTVRFDLGVWTNAISEEQIEYIAKKFLSYAERGKQAGFIVGPENHWGASRRIDIQKRMFKEVNHPNYGMLLHLGNWDINRQNDPMDAEMGKAAAKIDSGRADIVMPELAKQGFVFKQELTQEEKDANDYEMAKYAVHTHVDAVHSGRAADVIPKLLAAGYKGVLGIEHHSGKNEYANVAWQLACVNQVVTSIDG